MGLQEPFDDLRFLLVTYAYNTYYIPIDGVKPAVAMEMGKVYLNDICILLIFILYNQSISLVAY